MTKAQSRKELRKALVNEIRTADVAFKIGKISEMQLWFYVEQLIKDYEKNLK